METWERLFEQAMVCLDSISQAQVPLPRWTFGGGTALKFQLQHRESHDIDIFLESPKWLSVLSPRLNDTVETVCQDYAEDSHFLKLNLGEGEVDFIAAPLLTKPGALPCEILGRKVLVETPAEIIAKKLYFRGWALRTRDVIDIAVVLTADRRAVLGTASAWADRFDEVARRLSQHRTHVEEFHQELAGMSLLPPAEAVRANALDLVGELLDEVKRGRTPRRVVPPRTKHPKEPDADRER